MLIASSSGRPATLEAPPTMLIASSSGRPATVEAAELAAPGRPATVEAAELAAPGPRRDGKPRAPCTCFSLCSMAEIESFLDHIPSVVHSPRSPWHGYLRAVYRQPPPLPFALAALRFYYSNDQLYWPQTVEWPMSPCSQADGSRTMAGAKGASLGASGLKRSTPTSNKASSRLHRQERLEEEQRAAASRNFTDRRPRCPAAQCERWSWRAATGAALPNVTSASQAIGRDQLRAAVWFANRVGRSRGTLLLLRSEPPATRHDGGGHDLLRTSGFPRRRFWPGGSRLEVMRVNQPRGYEEGVIGYGLWFYAAPGSGMWLCTGEHALVLPHATDRFKLRAAWMTQVSAANRSAAVHDINAIRTRRKARDCFPLIAAALGFSTVQNVEGNHPLQGAAEVVSLAPSCMHAAAPIGTCPPRGLLSTGLPELHGGHGMQTCACDDAEPTLNCLGVASTQRMTQRPQQQRQHDTDHVAAESAPLVTQAIPPVLLEFGGSKSSTPWTFTRDNPCAGLV